MEFTTLNLKFDLVAVTDTKADARNEETTIWDDNDEFYIDSYKAEDVGNGMKRMTVTIIETQTHDLDEWENPVEGATLRTATFTATEPIPAEQAEYVEGSLAYNKLHGIELYVDCVNGERFFEGEFTL